MGHPYIPCQKINVFFPNRLLLVGFFNSYEFLWHITKLSLKICLNLYTLTYMFVIHTYFSQYILQKTTQKG